MMIRMMTSIVPSDMTRSPKARGRPQNATAARIKAYSGPRVLRSDPPNVSEVLRFPSPLVGEGGSLTQSGSETDEGSVSAERTPHPALRATFSHKGRRKKD